MFRLVGYHVPPSAASTPDRRAATTARLQLGQSETVSSQQISFNHELYSVILDTAGMQKQNRCDLHFVIKL